MQSIVEELYMGNVGFDAGYYPPDSPFGAAARHKHDSLERLLASLSDAQKEWFEQYSAAQGDIEEITRYDTYAAALKFGVLLMAELCLAKPRPA